jgi:hypothetical protein
VRTRDQAIAAVLLLGATALGLRRIAEAKNETAVGGSVFVLDRRHPDELAAFQQLRTEIGRLGDTPLSDRLGALLEDGQIWVAPSLGPDRWAVFVDSLSMVRRIYVRRLALLDPRAHLFPNPPPDIPPAHQKAFATLSLAGALRHELAHRDGLRDEAPAYARELEWYEGRRRSPFLDSLPAEERRAWEWAFESARLSARRAAESAGVP